MTTLELYQINRRGGTQPRQGLNPQTVQDYAEVLLEGRPFKDPCVVFYDGTENWLADGYHRCEAVEHVLGLDGRVEVDIRQGTQRDALLYSLGPANRENALQMTPDEKQARVRRLLEDQEWATWSNYKIAEHCGVSEKTVRRVRDKLTTAGAVVTATRQGSDGRMINTAKIGKAEPKIELPAQPAPPEEQFQEGDMVKTRSGHIAQITKIDGRFGYVEGDSREHFLSSLTKLPPQPLADDQATMDELAIDEQLVGQATSGDGYYDG